MNVSAIGALAYLGFIIAIIAGWVMNLIHVVGSLSSALTTELVVRLVGVPVFPLGVVMGWFA